MMLLYAYFPRRESVDHNSFTTTVVPKVTTVLFIATLACVLIRACNSKYQERYSNMKISNEDDMYGVSTMYLSLYLGCIPCILDASVPVSQILDARIR